jgi:rod shape-determining protein MreD
MSGISRLPDDRGEALRRLVPAGTVFIALLLMAIPLPLAWGVMPNIALLLVILWASIQPRLVPAWAAALLGLFADLMFGGPIGIWAFLFAAAVIAVRLVEAWAEGHSLLFDWIFAGLVTVLAHLLAWQLLRFLGATPPLLPFLAQALLTVIAYPAVAALAARIQLRLAVSAD